MTAQNRWFGIGMNVLEIGDKNQEIGINRNSGRIRGINRSYYAKL